MRYLTAKQAAEISGYAYKSILDMCRLRKMPCRQPRGKNGKWLIPYDEFLKWLDERQGTAPPPTKNAKKVARLNADELW